MINPIIRRIPANATGRDFVIGDLHGEIGKLSALLKSAHFDTTKDRLFSVGDLVDRGQDSLSCLALLGEPWFFAVRGNHEDMLLDYVGWRYRGKAPRYNPIEHPFTFNGGDWFFTQVKADRARIADEILHVLGDALPHVLIVGDGPGRFHVVHAELDAGARGSNTLPQFLAEDTILDAGGPFPGPEYIDGFGMVGGYVDRLTWGRGMVYAKRNGNLAPGPDYRSGLSPTFCGHTPFKASRALAVFESHVHLDTGAFIPEGQLTMVEVGRENAKQFSVVLPRN